MQDFIAKLQNLTETKKKVILFSIIGTTAIILGFFEITATKGHVATIQKSLQTMKFPDISMTHSGSNKLQDISTLIGQLKTGGTHVPADWKSYSNNDQTLALSYPPTWQVDTERTSANQVRLVSVQSKEQSAINIIMAKLNSETTQKISAEQKIDTTIEKMKEIILPKNKITAGLYEGYETIGTLCIGTCAGSAKDKYYPFAIAYVTGNQGQLLEVQYGEAIDEIWKKDMKEWKYYDQFKQIISTFK